jgi:hypothetical protein
MHRITAGWITLLAVALVGCAAKRPPVNEPATPPPQPALETPAHPITSDLSPTPTAPAAVQDGAGLRLIGIGDASVVDWAPSSQTALVEAPPALYRLRMATKELRPVPDMASVQKLGWAGPDTALLVRWSGELPAARRTPVLEPRGEQLPPIPFATSPAWPSGDPVAGNGQLTGSLRGGPAG